MISVTTTRMPGCRYPKTKDYSPKECYPEYQFGSSCLSRANDVYGLVRKCLADHGCDSENFGKSNWNPLGKWIQKGQRVFVLTNFVMHRRPWESYERFLAKCTHGSVIRPVLDYACIATGDPGLVCFGNAPLQSCEYEKVLQETGADSISRFYRDRAGVEVGPHDLRLLKSRWTNFGAQVDVRKESLGHAVTIDLGRASFLEELFVGRGEVQVRVGDYCPSDTMSYHDKGKHVYVINRKILESDVIISIPKLKTHQKVGITCALKGTVGSIGRKECLAHHRIGSSEAAGDEYPFKGMWRDYSSYMSDKACYMGTDISSNVYRVASKILSRIMRMGPRGITYGAWYGNDTAWRMTLDIARIMRFGRIDGTMDEAPARNHLSFVDGIVAGEGEGPMAPIPRKLGVLLFSPDICAADLACARIMGFDPSKIKLIENSFRCDTYPITEEKKEDIIFTVNGKNIEQNEMKEFFRPTFKPPKGWVGVIEDK